MRGVFLIGIVLALVYVAYLQMTSTKSALAPTTGDAKNKMEQVEKEVEKIQEEHMEKLKKIEP